MTRQRPDYYSILGAQLSANTVDIRKKYRKAALRLHPDKGGSSQAFQLLTLAFEVLSCPVARAAYDKMLAVSNFRSDKVRGTTTRAKAFRNTVLKRTAPVSNVVPESKRQCRAETGKRCNAGRSDSQDCIARIGTPLRQVRTVLQDMNAVERRTALQALPPCVQAGLLLFMEMMPNISSTDDDKIQSPCGHRPSDLKSAVSGISARPAARKGTDVPVYTAHVHIKALRFYTRGHHELEVALDRQVVLIQIRQALHTASSENPNFWDDPTSAYQICLKVLGANATSEAELGLSAFVYLRAGHYLLQSCTIISPVMPLQEVLQQHARLLHARRSSWQELRQEWVQLMQSPWLPLTRRKTHSQAEAVADAARSSALHSQLRRAAGRAAKALRSEELRRHHRSKVQEKRELIKEHRETRLQARAAVAERRASKSQMDAWKARHRWAKRADLTLDDIMRGPPIPLVVSC